MSDIDKEKVEAQLNEWKGKLDELRVKGHLLKMEYRDKQDETVTEIESAYEAAKAKFLEMKDAGEVEAGKLGAGFTAAWDAFKQAYDGATEDEA